MIERSRYLCKAANTTSTTGTCSVPVRHSWIIPAINACAAFDRSLRFYSCIVGERGRAGGFFCFFFFPLGGLSLPFWLLFPSSSNRPRARPSLAELVMGQGIDCKLVTHAVLEPGLGIVWAAEVGLRRPIPKPMHTLADHHYQCR